MDRSQPTRREFVSTSAGLFGSGWLWLNLPAIASLSACARDAARDDAPFRILSVEQGAAMRAFAARIIPSDEELPGAEEAGAAGLPGTPFCAGVTSVSVTPPDFESEEFVKAYKQVKDLGGDPNARISTDRWPTPTSRSGAANPTDPMPADNTNQTFIGIFWGYDGTALLCAPPRLYNMIATSVALKEKPITNVEDMSLYLAYVNVAMADAGIAEDFLDLGKLGTDQQWYIPVFQATYFMVAHHDAMQYLPEGADVDSLTYDQLAEWAAAAGDGGRLTGTPDVVPARPWRAKK